MISVPTRMLVDSKTQDTVNQNLGMDIVYDPNYVGPDPADNASVCCKFVAPVTDAASALDARFAAICIPGIPDGVRRRSV
jgi:hypothetical protein